MRLKKIIPGFRAALSQSGPKSSMIFLRGVPPKHTKNHDRVFDVFRHVIRYVNPYFYKGLHVIRKIEQKRI